MKMILTICLMMISTSLNAQSLQEWVAIYNGPNNGPDEAVSIAVDNQGNVYVTGSSEGTGTGKDYATIKYNSTGVEQWVQRYNGPSNGNDFAESITADNSGNVYVTGRSKGSGIFDEYATIKYNSDGDVQWVQRYNGPGNSDDFAKAIAVDNSGNVYVTGWSVGNGTNSDYATIKYDSVGIEQWVARYNGPGNGQDDASSIAVDNQGNVYVTGTSLGTGTGLDYATIKYNSDGVEQWVQRYTSTGSNSDAANAIIVDNSGNVYVTGRAGFNLNYATIKYNSDGVQQWVQLYNGPANNTDEATAIAVDILGNVYVTGYSRRGTTSSDYATIKYNSDGIQQWLQRYPNSGVSSALAYAIAIDDESNVFITGTVAIGAGTLDIATIKYNTEGVQQWIELYNGPANSNERARSIAIDNQGGIYVTGYGDLTPPFDDYITIKYSEKVIPVELISFSAAVFNNTVILNWFTASEVNNRGFEIQRINESGYFLQGDENANWQRIGFVEGSGTTTEQQSYSFLDADLTTSLYSYRLKQIDLDGTYKFSQIVEVSLVVPEEFHLSQNHPNPFNPSTKISWQSPVGSHQTLKIYDVLGNEVVTLVDEFREAGRYEVEFNVAQVSRPELASGIYLYRLQAGSFVETKKMILIK